MYTDHSTTSSERRPLTMRKRNDLEVQETVYQDQPSWIIKDPVALKYFRLQAPEFAAFEMIDGINSYAAIKLQLENQFPEMKLRIEDVYSLVTSLHRSGLLHSDAVGQDQPLTNRHNKELKQKGLKLLMSVMSLKFPGVDPERFLNWLHPKIAWMFSLSATIFFATLCISALMLVLTNFDEFYRRLPEFSQFFDFNNLLFLGAIIVVTKSIHELGHGLMCKHFGGECHEIGFMLMVMTPAMYCDTSDSWTLPNKWHRIAIGAGGMYVEVVLAAFATFVWWYTQPGVMHYLSLNIMFLCSFSTLLFNANPLLRYDGYYMLSDFLEIPNLSQKSNMALVDRLKVTCLAMDPNRSRLMPEKKLVAFALYSVASFLYRWFIMFAIFWFIIQVLQPYGLEVIGHFLIAMSLFGMVVLPLFKLVNFFSWPGRFRDVSMFRLLMTCAVVGLLGWGFFSIPIPNHINASFVIRPVNPQMVYATAPGVLTKVNFKPGDKVTTGATIAELENIDLEITMERLRGSAEQLAADISAYRAAAATDPTSAHLVVESKTKLADIQNKINLQNQVENQLVHTANRDGMIMPPPNIPARAHDSASGKLQSWTGTPLDAPNRGLFLETGTLICMVADPQKMKATLAIDQSDRALVAKDQTVRLMLDERPGVELTGRVNFIGEEPMTTVPRELSQNNGGGVATRVTETGEPIPILTSYEVSVSLDPEQDVALLLGYRGTAKIKTGDMPLGQRVVRYLTNLIRFR